MDILRLRMADGRSFDFPADAMGETLFYAETPALPFECNVAEVRLIPEGNLPILRFVLGSFTILENEAGIWTVGIVDQLPGQERFYLEHYATEHYGERVRHPAVSKWDNRVEMMVTN